MQLALPGSPPHPKAVSVVRREADWRGQTFSSMGGYPSRRPVPATRTNVEPSASGERARTPAHDRCNDGPIEAAGLGSPVAILGKKGGSRCQGSGVA